MPTEYEREKHSRARGGGLNTLIYLSVSQLFSQLFILKHQRRCHLRGGREARRSCIASFSSHPVIGLVPA